MPSSSSLSPSSGCANGLVTTFHFPSRYSGGHRVVISGKSAVSLTLVSSTSDSIFLLNGAVNVLLFCTIRRVIPVREVATALFAGKINHLRKPPGASVPWRLERSVSPPIFRSLQISITLSFVSPSSRSTHLLLQLYSLPTPCRR